MSGGIAWTGIITGLITATATLLGVWLTQRHGLRVRRLDRHEDRRVEQREALEEVLATGREFVTSLHAVMLVAAMTGNSVDFASTSVVEAHGPIRAAHHRALLTARLLVRDARLREEAALLSAALDKVPERLPPLMDSAKTHGRAEPEAIGRALGHAKAYGGVLDDLERLTRERVVDAPDEPQRRWRRGQSPRRTRGGEAGEGDLTEVPRRRDS